MLQELTFLFGVLALGVGGAVVTETLNRLPEVSGEGPQNGTSLSAPLRIQEPISLWNPAAGITCRLEPDRMVAPPGEPSA